MGTFFLGDVDLFGALVTLLPGIFGEGRREAGGERAACDLCNKIHS